MCEFESCSWRDVLDTTLCDKVFSDLRHDITEILLQMALDIITLTLLLTNHQMPWYVEVKKLRSIHIYLIANKIDPFQRHLYIYIHIGSDHPLLDTDSWKRWHCIFAIILTWITKFKCSISCTDKGTTVFFFLGTREITFIMIQTTYKHTNTGSNNLQMYKSEFIPGF